METQPPAAPHQAIYRRWRAQTFAEIVGQEAVVETLRNAVRLGRVAHAYLFVGPRGTGKTSMARILAKAINCSLPRDGEPDDACPSCIAIREGRALDLLEIDAASNRGIDQIRELREKVRYAPTDLRRKVYILDEAHQITRDGWAALLKTLEEPPEHVVFIFASTDPQEIPPTILSRVQRFDFRRLRPAEIAGKLERILAAADRSAEQEAVALVASLAAGGMRDAESMLDQLLSTADGTLTADRVRELLGLADEATVDAFLEALVRPDPLAGIALLDGLEEHGRDLRTFHEQVVERLRRLIAVRLTGEHATAPRGVATASVAELARVARRLAGAETQRTRSGSPRFALELALLAPLAEEAPPAAGEGLLAAAPGRRGTAVPAAKTPAPSPQERPALAATVSEPEGAVETAPAVDEPEAAVETAPPAAVPVAAESLVAAPASAGSPAGRSPRSAAPSPPEPDRELERLRERWADVVSTVGRNPAARPLIEACRPLSIEGRTVILGFPEDKGFLAAALERRRSLLEQGISQVLGSSFVVRCVATNVEALPPVAIEDEARALLEQARRIFGGETAEVGDIT